MKKVIYIPTIILCLFFTTACRKALKDVKDYYPEVSTVSAIVNADGTVLVTAEVLSEGSTSLENIGFCMDTLPVPHMLSNQKVVNEIAGSKFSAVYSLNFNSNKTYYFRSWATNANGYTYGNVMSISNIKAIPVEAPCTLNLNTSSIGLNGSASGSVYKVTSVDHFSSTWDISTTGYDAAAGNLKFSFGSELKTKIYTTTKGSAYGDLVSIDVSSGFLSGRVNAGSKVYVNQKSTGVFEITLCEATWTPDSFTGNYTIKARFVSPF